MDLSAARQGVAGERPCNGYKMTGKDINSCEMGNERPVRVFKIIRCRYVEILLNNAGSIEDVNEVGQEGK